MPPQQQKDIWLNLCSVITVFIVFLPPVRVNVKRWFTTGKYYHNQALMSRFSLLFFYIFAKRKELWFNADKFEILHVSCSFVNDPVHRDVIHSASAIHSLGRFYVLRKFVLIRRAPVLPPPFLGFVCYEKRNGLPRASKPSPLRESVANSSSRSTGRMRW